MENKKKGDQHDDDVQVDVARTMGDVGDHDGSTTVRATKRAIQRSGRVTHSTGI